MENNQYTVPGYVTEIFSSRQGEGLYVGEEQIFLRLAGCACRCIYCDTAESLTTEGHSKLTVEETLAKVRSVRGENGPNSVSVTGGEPLAQVEFLLELLPALRQDGFRIHLETNGAMPAALRKVVEFCDVVAMDIKLPSAAGRAFWKEHAEFLAAAGGKAFVKIVLTSESTMEEWQRAVNLLASANPAPPLIIQPATPIEYLADRLGGGPGANNEAAAATAGPREGKRLVSPPSQERLAAFYDGARQLLKDVRISPQMHPVWGVR